MLRRFGDQSQAEQEQIELLKEQVTEVKLKAHEANELRKHTKEDMTNEIEQVCQELELAAEYADSRSYSSLVRW